MTDKPEQIGKRRGRPKTVDRGEVRRLFASGYGATYIARRLGVARSSIYRALAS